MNIETMQGNIQSAEQYKIRAKREAQTSEQAQEAQALQNAQQLQQAEQTSQVRQAEQVDEYDKANPVGEEVEGIYSLAHDEEGNLTVKYTQPATKSDDTEETTKTEAKSAKSEASSGAGASSATSATSSDDDDELEQLEQQRDALRQQLNREADENVKAQLRTQLQAVEAEIIQLKTEA
ncbi:MAG: hypothetical protein IJG65_06470 [Synergistaceae bacterium]|nr:hypothetical protein [Synergistaceae bacterium]